MERGEQGQDYTDRLLTLADSIDPTPTSRLLVGMATFAAVTVPLLLAFELTGLGLGVLVYDNRNLGDSDGERHGELPRRQFRDPAVAVEALAAAHAAA